MRTLVVLPSYNERDNIISLIDELLLNPNLFICVVDDSSPDGTAELVKSPMKDRCHLILRQGKGGRGSAVREGMLWGLAQKENPFSQFVEMDCDFSHSPKEISKGVSLLGNTSDLVIGSRYPDGKIIGWPWSRRIFSSLSNSLIRFLIDREVSDYTNGFRFYSRKAAELIFSKSPKNQGYIYLSETLAYALKKKIVIKSFPITFVDRQRGQSNLGFGEVFAALKGILLVAWDYRYGGRD